MCVNCRGKRAPRRLVSRDAIPANLSTLEGPPVLFPCRFLYNFERDVRHPGIPFERSLSALLGSAGEFHFQIRHVLLGYVGACSRHGL